MDKILIIDRVSKKYPGRAAVSDISFEVLKGSIHGFLGPNGAGKSTTMKMIAGMLSPSEGEIRLFGEKVHSNNFILKNKLGLLPENPPLYNEMKVHHYLEYVARLHGVKKVKERTQSVMEELRLVEFKDRLIGNLSKGYKQRVGLAQAIIYEAPFLILDEPTNGLDPHAVVEFRELIKKLAIDKTILFSSHILSEVEQLCDHVTIIHQGKIRASGPLDQIQLGHKKGLSLKIGLALGEKLPDLNVLGDMVIQSHLTLTNEEQFILNFKKSLDIRSELAQLIVSQGRKLLTLSIESPELEDIFLEITESKK